jgi:hypothetical protein
MLVSLVWAVIGVQDGFLLHIPALVAVGLFVALELFFQKGPPRDVVFDRELDAVSYGGRHLCQVSSVVGLELGEGPGSDDNRSGFNLVYLDGETEKRVAVDAGGSRSDYAEIRDAVNGWVFTHQRAHA